MRTERTTAADAPSALSLLERYRPLIDDWQAFSSCMRTPLPGCVWANPQRIDGDGLHRLLLEDGLAPQPLPWYPGAFRLPPQTPIGHHWWYRAGLCHSQEEASLVPVRLLDPRPGERILDLCAAPGGKTAQIALALENKGTVVANDVAIHRLRPLRATIERLGLMNVTTTRWDGASYPNAAGRFARILVDAPCSCEGTLRKSGAPDKGIAGGPHDHLPRLQKALLQRALGLCRPGGHIIYSTCTFAPEENEQVIDDLLRDHPEQVDLEPACIPGLRSDTGITRWQGRDFDPRLRRTLRLWPQQNDSGGFFVAVLRKSPLADAGEQPCAPLSPLPSPELSTILLDRFGMDSSALADWQMIKRTGRGQHFVSRHHQPPRKPDADATGLLLLRHKARPPKPSTPAAMLLAQHATRNVIDLEPGQLDAYLNRATFALTPRQIEAYTGSGNLLIRYRGHGLGSGFFDAARGTLRSMFPKRWTVASE